MWKKICRKIGWCFYELSFWWFDLFDYPIEDYRWKWYHYFTYFAGTIPLVIGCFFYEIIGNEKDEK